MPHSSSSLPLLFKGIALFTPGGDLVYCIDPDKQNRWHLDLCVALQEVLHLPEPPHFLVPCYTATIDRWQDPRSQEVRVFAEAYPAVRRYQGLLNSIFDYEDGVWHPAPVTDGLCDPILMSVHYPQFSELWEDHDLVLRLEKNSFHPISSDSSLQVTPLAPTTSQTGYVLRLFVAGNSVATERILQKIHEFLEEVLHTPYTLKVIDILKHPEQAEANQVAATPMLVRVWPQPVRRIVGELDHLEAILRLLDTPHSIS